MRRTSVLTASWIGLCAMSSVFAETWYVDCSVSSSRNGRNWARAFKTIQEGIEAASDGDTVIVAEGVYVENIHFRGKNIVLTSTSPLDPNAVEKTVIDGNEKGPAVTFSGSENETCVLSGFTIRNGKAEYGGGIYGGESGEWTFATIQNNVITGNSACGGLKSGGGGMYGCSGIIEGNTISGNYATVFGGGLHGCHGTIQNNAIVDNVCDLKGGGLDMCLGTIQNNKISGNFSGISSGGLRHCHGIVRNNVITDNVAGEVGGGLHTCFGTIEHNLISGNRAGTAGGGLHNCEGNIENNTVSENQAGHGGGGLHTCHGTIRNNLIWRNMATRQGGGLKECDGAIQGNAILANLSEDYGGGLCACDGVIRNNTIAGNCAKLGGGGLAYCSAATENNTIFRNSAGTVGGGVAFCGGTIHNCILWGNVADREGPQLHHAVPPTYSCIQDWTGGGEGNIALEPGFVDVEGLDGDPDTHEDNDYRLTSLSPCIDRGKNEDWMRAAFDRDGRMRILDGNGDGMRVVDMGAYEHVRQVILVWYVDGSVSAPGDGKSWATAFAKIQEGIDAASDKHTVIVAQGTYVENIQFNGKNITLRSIDPLDPAVVASTILDGGQSGSVVTFSGTEDASCLLSGITIRNGKAERGGGICGGNQEDHTHATIEYNVITGNSTIESTIEWGGGLVFCDGMIRNNVISENYAGYYGGGLSECQGTIRNNLILGNTASFGGGLDFCGGSIENCVISGNTATLGGGVYECSGEVKNCIIWGNSSDQVYYASGQELPVTYCCIQDWTQGGEGNVAEAPRFVEGTHQLSMFSPCIDRGKNENWMWTAKDFDGNVRVVRGVESLTVDMGAYEYSSFPFRIVEIAPREGGYAELSWNSRPEDTYSVWSCSDFPEGNWIEEVTVHSEDAITRWMDAVTEGKAKFYRIELK